MNERSLFKCNEKWTNAQFIRTDGTIEIFPNYLVSDCGRIMSTKGTPKILKIVPRGSSNEPGVTLCIGCHAVCRRISRIMLSSFYPEQYTKGATASHINRINTDNRLCNLQWSIRPCHPCKSIGAGVPPASLL